MILGTQYYFFKEEPAFTESIKRVVKEEEEYLQQMSFVAATVSKAFLIESWTKLKRHYVRKEVPYRLYPNY